MKKLITLFTCLVIYGITMGTDVSGIIAANTTWNLAGSPYVVIGEITVNNGVTLTVNPNVIVKFNSGQRMTVLGTLTANTATFTSNQAVPAPNDWLYIQVGNASFAGAANFTSCFLRYAQQFYIYSGTATLSSTNLENFYYYGIYNSGTLNMTGGINQPDRLLQSIWTRYLCCRWFYCRIKRHDHHPLQTRNTDSKPTRLLI